MNSPSVTSTTIDKSYYVPHITNEVACFVGHFERGPINLPIWVTSIDQFKFLFGRGIDDCHHDWYQVYNFLQYSGGIWVVRTSGVKLYNANNGGDIYFNTFADWTANNSTLTVTGPIRFIARTAGVWGNLINVCTFTKDDWLNNVQLNDTTRAKDVLEFFEDNYVGIAVFRNNTLVEKFYLTLDEISNINDDSLYVYVKLNSNTVLSQLSLYGQNNIKLSGGYNTFPTDEDFKVSYDLLLNPDVYDIDIVIGNEKANELAIEFAEARKDCIAFIGLPTVLITYLKLLMGSGKPQEVAYLHNGSIIGLDVYKIPSKLTEVAKKKINRYINSLPKSQFTHFTMNAKVQLDMFTNTYKVVNVAADIAGLKAQTSLTAPWIASAGLEKGSIKNLQKMYMVMSDKENDEYYKKGLNIMKNNTLMSQKTFFDRPSAFNRVNVRSLFNHLEKNTKKILNKFVFEENTLNVRKIVASHVKQYLETVKINNGITDARVYVKAGENNEIVVEIAVQPTYVAEYITIRMINAGTNTMTTIVS